MLRKGCENCGAAEFIHATPKDNKGALTRVVVDPDGRMNFNASAGTPVDVYVCRACGLVRLFACTQP